MTLFLTKEELKLLVVGDVDCGKRNFIEKFLSCYRTILEIHRDTDDVYVNHIPDRTITIPFSSLKTKCTCNTILLHNVNDIEMLSDPKFYDKVDVIFYCYGSDKPESFQNLEEKWIPRLKLTAQYSFLVANLSAQQNIDQIQQISVPCKTAKRLQKRLGLRCFVQQTDDYENLFMVFEYFLELALSRRYRKQFLETLMGTVSKRMEIEPSLSSNIQLNTIQKWYNIFCKSLTN